VVPLAGTGRKISDAAAIEIAPAIPTGPLDEEVIKKAIVRYRTLSPEIPVGLTLAPGNVFGNIRIAVNAGADFVMLSGIPPQRSTAGWIWPEDKTIPEINVLAEAIEGLRAINREEDIDILYFGGILSGADVARALALGATAVVLGQAARIAVESGSPEEPGSDRLVRLVNAFLMEAAMLTRCCGKTDVHNIEPEDLRSLTVETSQATGIPLVGSDEVYRK
jgi:glutamate synthase domain-containing protein 2